MDVDPSRSTDLLTAHLDAHISVTRHHFTGAPDPPEPPYAPPYHPPTGQWTAAEKVLFFHALSTYSCFRSDLIASSIGTKSQLDVIIYLDLCCTPAHRSPQLSVGPSHATSCPPHTKSLI